VKAGFINQRKKRKDSLPVPLFYPGYPNWSCKEHGNKISALKFVQINLLRSG